MMGNTPRTKTQFSPISRRKPEVTHVQWLPTFRKILVLLRSATRILLVLLDPEDEGTELFFQRSVTVYQSK